MSDFEKQIYAMFDHIWDCDINHPIFEDTVGELMDAVIQCYNNLPSAQPRKKGKWINKKNIYGVAYCSECDYELHTNDTNFCPNCRSYNGGESDDN